MDKASKAEKTKSPGGILVAMALDMSWRLALVVLVPVVGGFELDRAVGSAPALTIAGFLLAMAGTYVIMKQTFAKAEARGRLATKEQTK